MPVWRQQPEAVADREAVVGGEGVGDDRLAVAQVAQRRRPALLPFDLDASPMSRVGAVDVGAVPPLPRSLACAERIVATASTPGTLRGARRGAAGDRREAVAVLDHQAAGEVFVDDLGDRALQAGGEDRHEDDERDADHERGRGDRGAAGLRVAFSRARRPLTPAQALERRADERGDRPHELRAEQRDGEEDGDRAGAERRGRAAARRAAEEPVGDDPAAGEQRPRATRSSRAGGRLGGR